MLVSISMVLQETHAQVSDVNCGLFFSEYAEGSSNNKYLEIYNPTDAAIDLTGYAFPNVGNAPNVPGEYEFWNEFDAGATIGAGETYMIVHPSAEAGLLAVADITFSFLSNGDDGFILVEGTEADFTLVDAIGNWDGDPGSGWDVAGVSNATKDHTLRRKSDVTQGNGGDWYASAGTNADDSEWIVLENNYSINNAYEGLDSHDFTGTCGAPEPGEALTMRIFHNNDGESELLGVDRFGALLNDMRAESDSAGIPHVMVSSGDNVKPSLAFNVFLEGGPSYDAIALDHLDYNGICIGNHDFDAGTEVLADLIEAFPNNPTPFLSANLDFTNEPSLDVLVQQGRIARSITLDVDGQQVGLIGLTTRDLAGVTAPGNTIIGQDLAGILQAEVDSLEGLGINKIILVSHLQGLVADDLDGGGDFAIAAQTRGIDVWVAGGGNQMLTNDPDYDDIYLQYPSAEETTYPLVAQNVDGEPVYMVTTVGNYDYLGALQVTFDENGVVVDTHSDEYSDTYRASDYPESDAYLYDNVVAPIEAIYADADTIGYSEIAWDLRKTTIRARESGFGNMVADAFLAAGRRFAEVDASVDSPQMAITNGGGLRTDVLYDAGDITDLQVQNILPFDNTIAVVEDVSTDRLKLILENAYSMTSFQNGAVYSDDGRFGHIAGLTVVYDLFGTSYEHNAQGQTLVEGERVVSAILDDGTVLIENGTPVAGLTVDIATNNFLAEGGPAFSGGDYYPFDQSVPANLTTELYAESVIEFIVDTLGGLVAAADYPENPGNDAGRIQVLLPSCDNPDGCIYGCDDATACNYDAAVTSNDGSCVFPEEGLDCDGNCASDTDEDGICDQDEVGGCIDQSACNFDPNATDNNGTCEYPEPGSDCGTGTCDLFISEYGVQAGTNNRYVEIYNPTSYTVNLDNYAWPNVSNSNPFPGSYEYWNTFNEGAMLAPGEVYVVAHPEADAAILAEADQTFQYIADGNVGFAIVKGQPDSFEIVDFFANWEGDNDALGFWNVCGDAQTDNVVLVRLPEFQGNPLPSGMDNSSEDGVTEFVGGSFGTCNTDCEWEVRSADDYSGLGAHTHNSGCAQVEPTTCDLFISEYGVVAGTDNRYVEIYNPTGAPVLLDDYAWPNVSNSNPFPGAYEYWNGFNAGHVLQPGDVYVLAHPDADAAILAEADQTFPYMPDGNAGFALVRGTEADFEIIDFFANYEGDNDEIGYWSVCDGSTTDNVVLVRRPQYQGNPNPSGEDLSSEDGITEFFGGSLGSSANDCEWFVRSTTDFSDLGMHTYSGACAQPEIPACDLFISEYGVGSGSNRWVEIYNPTGYDVSLDGYAWPNVSNSNPFPGSYEYWNGFNDGHVLAAGDVYILAHPDADAAILAEADQTFPYMPDGNAGFALVKGTEADFEIIDFFANYEGDNDEVGFWTVCGDETVTTDNVTLVRKSFYQGNPNPSGEDRSSEDGVTEFTMGSLAAGVCEWDIYPADDFTHIGMHTYEGACAVAEPVPGCKDEMATNFDADANVEDNSLCTYAPCDLFISEYGVGSGSNRWVEIYNPTGDDVLLDGYAWPNVSNSNPFPGSYEYWNGFNDGHVLAAGDVYILAHPDADAAILAEADQTFPYMPDGNAGFALVKGEPDSFEIIDFFANYEGDNDEVGFWTVCGDETVTTDNVTLVRMSAFQGNPNPSGEDRSSEDGVTEFTLGSLAAGVCEWDIYAADDFSHIGMHTYDGQCATGGCTDMEAENYDPSAGYDDGSCFDSNVADEVAASFATGVFDEGAAEIVDYHAGTQRLFFVNANDGQVGALSMANPDTLEFLFYIALDSGKPNSVAVVGDAVAVAVENDVTGVAGEVRFFDTDGNFLNSVPAGFLPDALTVSDDGTLLAVANEGEPDYNIPVDPEGSATIVDLSNGVMNAVATQVSFTSITESDLDESVRIFGPQTNIAQDLEPEYVAFNGDNSQLFVSCQENNAMVVIDVMSATVSDIWGLGFKDHLLEDNALDASNSDGAINITNWPAKGMYQPDAIHSYTVGGETYILTANEGDAREYFYEDSLGNEFEAYVEETRVEDVTLDQSLLDAYPGLQENENLGRIKMTTSMGDTDGDGDFDEIYTFGGRSFSIYTTDGQQVYDSGSDFERITAELIAENFNSTNDENDSFDNRSDDKGPEPEGIEIGMVNTRMYAFIGLERVGGVMVYDITDPLNPTYERYLQNRDFDGNAEAGTAGDLGPEGLVFVGADESADGEAYIVTSNEVSGTITAHRLTSLFDVVYGCTDEEATNYDADANTDDGSCEYIGCELFISEYGVGSGSNRWVEIYNPTGQDVELDGYAWPNVSNSNPFPGSYEYWNGFNDGHVLAAGDVYILAHPDADAAILAEADQTFPYMPDGNAGFALVKGTEADFEIIDMFANYEGDNDGIGSWTVCGDASVTTDNVTLVRKSAFQGNPNPSGEDLASEDGITVFTEGSLAAGVCAGEIYPADDFTHLGMHTYEGNCTQPPVQGCMDEAACNFDALAEMEVEGDCDYESCVGCMVFQACNFDALATQNDYELCDFSECAGCTYPAACNYDPTASQDDGSCDYLAGDLNGSGAVTVADILLLLQTFASTCD